MTEIAFHFNIPDRIAYLSRLLRKAVGRSDSIVVVAEPAALDKLDRKLWELSATDFVGHWREGQDAGTVTEAMQERARVWLTEDVGSCPRHDVLVSLMPQVPAGFEQFARLIEVVSLDEADRAQARERWRYYTSRGYQIQRHDVQVKG